VVVGILDQAHPLENSVVPSPSGGVTQLCASIGA
jgi:hypothetical protein